MRRIYTLLFAVFAALSVAVCAAALEVMPVDAIEPGMIGTGYSVFSGTQPEKFKATIIDIMPNAIAGHDLILARLSGANLEFTGIIAGMSGSPVYIDGKLIGAVAYAFPWSKEPIAGITPIEAMTELWDNMDDSKNKKAIRRKLQKKDPGGSTDLNAALPAASGASRLQPIATPIYFAGFSPETIDFFQQHFSEYNLMPIAGGSGMIGDDVPGVNDMQPGGVITTPLMSGDLRAAALGTITAREGDRILAFGHPFFNVGPTAIPMGGGKVHTVIANQSVSFKMGSPGKVLGVIERDQRTAIAGTIGGKSEMFPLTIEVDDPELARSRTFNVDIAQIESLAPYLLIGAVAQAVSEVSGGSDEVTVRFTLDGRIKDYDKPFHFEDMAYSQSGFSARAPLGYITNLLTNPYRDVAIEEAVVKVTISHTQDVMDIVSVTVDRSTFHPGDNVTAFLRLKPYGGDEVVKKITFPIPTVAPEGPAILSFEGGGFKDGYPQDIPISNFDQMWDVLHRWIPENTICVRIIYRMKEIGIMGQELQGLPLSMKNTLAENVTGKSGIFDAYTRMRFHADNIIAGTYPVGIKIEKEYR